MFIVTSHHPDDTYSTIKYFQSIEKSRQFIVENICTSYNEDTKDFCFDPTVEYYDSVNNEIKEYANKIINNPTNDKDIVRTYRFDDTAYTIINLLDQHKL